MDDHVIEILRAVVEVDEKENEPPSAAWIALDGLNEEAFDALQAQIRSGQLLPRSQVNALRALGGLTKHACQSRREDLLELALENTRGDSILVRSAAVNMSIWLTSILEGAPHKMTRPENLAGAQPSLRKRVRETIARALELGIDPEQDEFARAFLASSDT